MGYGHSLADAANHYTRALALEPSNLEVITNAAVLAQNLGRLDQALELQAYKVAHDPVSTIGHINFGIHHLYAGHLDAAIAEFHTALNLSPGSYSTRQYLSYALLQKGDKAAALEVIRQEPSEPARLMGLSVVNFALDNRAASDAALAEAMKKYGRDSACDIALVLAFRRENDRAYEWLAKAFANRDPGLAAIIVHPWVANIRDDPRWLPFLHRLGSAPEQLAAIKFEVTLPAQ